MPDTTKPGAPDFIKRAMDLSRNPWSERWLLLDQLKDFPIEEGGTDQPIEEARMEMILGAFDAGLARTIFVSKREVDGEVSYVILDGRLTTEVLRRMGFSHWCCRIFYYMKPETEAAWSQELRRR